MRELHGCFNNKEIMIVELSVFHNLIVTASHTEEIYIWDYEFFKLLANIKLPKRVDPTAISITNIYPLMIIATNDCMIYVL